MKPRTALPGLIMQVSSELAVSAWLQIVRLAHKKAPRGSLLAGLRQRSKGRMNLAPSTWGIVADSRVTHRTDPA